MDVAWGIAAGLAITSLLLAWICLRLLARLRRIDHRRRSQAVLHGKAVEQFVPLAAAWPWPANGFRFLGDPIDGVQFNDDEVVLVEIKANRSHLNARQRRIRDLVGAGKVRFEVIRIR